MFFYRELPPSDPFANATVFRDDFTGGFDTNVWETYFYANATTYDVVDQSSLATPLPGATKALRLFTSANSAYKGGFRIKPEFQGGIWDVIQSGSNKSYSVRGMVMFEAAKTYWNSNDDWFGRCGLSVKNNPTEHGYFVGVGNSNPVGYSNLGTSDTVFNSSTSGGNKTNIALGSPLPTLPKSNWLGFRMDYQQVSSGIDKIVIYTRASLTEQWTKITEYLIGPGNLPGFIPNAWYESQNVTFGFFSQGSGNYDNSYFKAYLSNFEVYVKDGPI